VATVKIRTIKAKSEVILLSSVPPNAIEKGLCSDILELEQALSFLLKMVKRVDVEKIENIIEKTSSFAPINILAQSLVDYLEKGE